ncbi:MAG: 4-phosphopantetheinyl transferase [Evtepia sp.]|nr:4-phosphopantetheinyl transferase [Evtepia sp.]
MQIFGGTQDSSLAFLHRVLKLACNLETLPSISHTTLGKPFFPECPQLHFSLSHSENRIVCALDSHPIGVDIEIMKPRQNDLPSYALTAEEYANYLSLGGDWLAFYNLWTKKEAWSKYTGEGLSKTFRKAPPQEGLYFATYTGPDWLATVCGEGTPTDRILWLDS